MILQIIIPALAAYAITDVFEFANRFKAWMYSQSLQKSWLTKSLKPFDCRACLSFWLSLATIYFSQGLTIWLIGAFAAPSLAELFHCLIKALKKHGTSV